MTPQVITSRSNPLYLRLRKLAADAAAYRTLGSLWLEGEYLCGGFVRAGLTPALAVIAERGHVRSEVMSLAASAPKSVVMPDALFDAISGTSAREAIGFVIDTPPAPEVAPALATVVLDRIQDPGNVGSILRSAAALGIGQVLALQGTAALWSPKVLRAAMGAHFGLRLVEGLAEADLDRVSVPLIASSSHGGSLLHDAALPSPAAWLLGHEGTGVAASLMARCAMTVQIPQPGGQESLNVAAAAAILFYEAARRGC